MHLVRNIDGFIEDLDRLVTYEFSEAPELGDDEEATIPQVTAHRWNTKKHTFLVANEEAKAFWAYLESLLKFDATKAQAAPRKFKVDDTVIITGTSNAAHVGKRGAVTQVLDEIFNEVLLEGSTLRVFYEDKDLTPAD